MTNMPGTNAPSWGKTVGIFFACWVIAFICCVLTSYFFAQSSGMTGYSNGGLSMIVVGAISAAYYRSSGNGIAAVFYSGVAGAVIGFLAVYMSVSLM